MLGDDQMSTVLVTGGMGVIGSWVTRKLVEQGIKVVTYSRHVDTALVKDIRDRFDCVIGDVLDLPNILYTIKHFRIERIVHMAAVLPDEMDANPFMTYQINVDGTTNILEAARLMDIKKLVYASTQGVYAQPQGEYAHPIYKPIDEDYPKGPANIYAATKFFGENMVLNYQRIYGLNVIVMRFASIYGPGGQARHGKLALTSKIIESAMLGEPLKIPQGGDEALDMVSTRDVANGIWLACFADLTEHNVFHIGTGKAETFRHLIEIVGEIFRGAAVEIGPGLIARRTPGVRSFVLNIDRARRELGYGPQYDLETGVRDYVEMMKRLEIRPEVLS